jgi:hypothetical protein
MVMKSGGVGGSSGGGGGARCYLSKGVDQSLINHQESLGLFSIKFNQWQPMKEMDRYQHRSILIAKLLNPINGCIIQSILGVHVSRGDFG